jgi:hypothetical protein
MRPSKSQFSKEEYHMKDYQPLSIAAFCNVDKSILESDVDFPSGPQQYHGLPFEIGNGTGQLVGLGNGLHDQAIEIPLAATLRHVVFAHRLLDSGIPQGRGVGEVCAKYMFCFKEGEPCCVLIRDRLEIAMIPCIWGHWPLLARPDTKEAMQPRYQGSYGDAGYRQTEVILPWAVHFYLYYWTNPDPDRELTSLRIEPQGPRFLLGGITLSHLAEPPLVRAARRPVRITLLESEERQGNLEVDVDRGIATYPYSLPKGSPEDFLKDTHQGWGQEFNPTASPSYVEIAANPSATVTVKHSDEVLGSVRWGEVEEKGSAEDTDRVRIELVDPGRNWVRTKVVDEETGQLLPCRVHFRSPEGIPYQPHGHHPHVNSNNGTWHLDVGGDVRLGQITYAYIQGECQGWLPRGEVIVDVARGYEYHPLRTKVEIKPGQQELTLRLKRLANLNAERFYAGDTHVHFVSTQGAHLEASAEGVNVVNLHQSQWGHLYTSTEEFTGEPSVSRYGETIVYATQENRQHILGHLSLLGLKKPVMPWCSGGVDEAEQGGNLETTLSRWADACHAQGGTVIIPHIPSPNGEPATLIATGRTDAVEFLSLIENNHREYYRYLNCGYRLPLVGGTDKMDSGVPIGIYRTYVQIPENEEFSYDAWCRNLKAGRTFLSGGPLLWFKVEGQGVGSEIRLPKGGGTVEVEVVAKSVLPFHSLEIVMNGQVVERTEESSGTHLLSLKTRLRIDKHSWIAARCAGPNYTPVSHHDSWRRGIMAHTSPVYIAVGEDWWMFDLGTANYMLTLINGCISYIQTRSPQWKKGTVTHHHGQADHQAYLEEPFQEAIATIHKRMHQHGIPH